MFLHYGRSTLATISGFCPGTPPPTAYYACSCMYVLTVPGTGCNVFIVRRYSM